MYQKFNSRHFGSFGSAAASLELQVERHERVRFSRAALLWRGLGGGVTVRIRHEFLSQVVMDRAVSPSPALSARVDNFSGEFEFLELVVLLLLDKACLLHG